MNTIEPILKQALGALLKKELLFALLICLATCCLSIMEMERLAPGELIRRFSVFIGIGIFLGILSSLKHCLLRLGRG